MAFVAMEKDVKKDGELVLDAVRDKLQICFCEWIGYGSD